MNRKVLFISFAILLLFGLSSKAQDTTFIDRMKTSFSLPSPSLYVGSLEQNTNSISFGKIMLKDTYLSPNEYVGYYVGYSYLQIKPLELFDSDNKEPKGSIFGNAPLVRHQRLIELLENNSRISSVSNRPQNKSMYFIDNDFKYSLLYAIFKSRYGDWYLGGGGDFNIGSVYSTGNTNNPASMKLGISLIASTLYTYMLPVESMPIRMILNGNMSLAGCFFSPEFGESYYELFSLNNDFFKRIYFSHPKNLIKTNLKLSLDLPVLDWFNMNIGGFCNYYNSDINNINTKILSVGVSLGITNFVQYVRGRKVFNSKKYKTPL